VTTTITENPQAKEEVGKDGERMVEFAAAISKEDRDSLDELMTQAQAAYDSYLQAQRKVALAYQEQRRRIEESFKEIEEHADRLCAVAIERANRSLEKAEQEAEEMYKKAKVSARQVYQDSLTEALRIRRDSVGQAWEEARRNSEKISKVFQGEIKG
jgi:vacuolar-type H+-ATPase subunit H